MTNNMLFDNSPVPWNGPPSSFAQFRSGYTPTHAGGWFLEISPSAIWLLDHFDPSVCCSLTLDSVQGISTSSGLDMTCRSWCHSDAEVGVILHDKGWTKVGNTESLGAPGGIHPPGAPKLIEPSGFWKLDTHLRQGLENASYRVRTFTWLTGLSKPGKSLLCLQSKRRRSPFSSTSGDISACR